MRKLVLYLFPCLFLIGFCSPVKPKLNSYPSGLIFPLDKAEEIPYQGEIVSLIQRNDSNVYFSTRKGFVYFLDGLERRIEWKFEAPNPLVCPPYLSSGKIFVLDRENTIYSLDEKGRMLWKKEIEENITSGLGENQGMICLGTSEGFFFAFDSLNGEMLWRFQAEGAIRSSPVFANNFVIFGSDDGNLYFLDQTGSLVDKIKIGSEIKVTPLIDKNFLYFGTHDHSFYCVDLKKRRVKWKVKTGGEISSKPASDKKRIFFLCADNILYAYNKRNGSILWWQSLPSRSFYQLEIINARIVATSLSPSLVCFDVKIGEKQGEYEAEQEIRSNPLWFDPYLLINLYDSKQETGKLVFLKKILRATLSCSKQSPLKLGDEVTFTVSAAGFFHPKYEFYLKIGEETEIVQKISSKDSWQWFPEKEGDYVVGVRVIDSKESAVTEILFTIENEKKISLK